MLLISYVFAVFFILALMVDRLPLIKFINEISMLSKTSFTTIGSNTMEDSEKQKLLLTNSASIFKLSLKIATLILLVVAAGYLLMLAGDLLNIVKSPLLFSFLDTVPGIVISILAFSSWFLIKKIYVRARL
jgi:hypothetical protein